MAIDYKSDLDTKAWALLQANGTFPTIFKPGGWMKDDPLQVKQVANRRGIQEFPQIRIEVQNCQSIMPRAPQTFAMNSTSYTHSVVDVPVPITAKLVVTMTFDREYTKEKRFAAELLVRSIWMSAYPKFGIAYVSSFSIDENKATKKPPQDVADRIIVTQILNFSLRPFLSQLV